MPGRLRIQPIIPLVTWFGKGISQTEDGVRIEPAQRKAAQIKGEPRTHIPRKAPGNGVRRIDKCQ